MLPSTQRHNGGTGWSSSRIGHSGSPGQTTVAPYAVRAIPGAPVATPLAWEELEDPALHPRLHTLRTVPGRLDGGGDPWRDIAKAAAELPRG